jgi:hypothetical protein
MNEKAEAANLNDMKGLAVVYHVNGHDLGDTIEIVNASTGQVLHTLFGLYFSLAFARVGLSTVSGPRKDASITLRCGWPGRFAPVQAAQTRPSHSCDSWQRYDG